MLAYYVLRVHRLISIHGNDQDREDVAVDHVPYFDGVVEVHTLEAGHVEDDDRIQDKKNLIDSHWQATTEIYLVKMKLSWIIESARISEISNCTSSGGTTVENDIKASMRHMRRSVATL